MIRISNDEVYFENIPFYGSNIVTKSSNGLGGEIFFNPADIDFFGGDINATSITAGKEVYNLPATNIYRFDKDNLLEYLDCIKDEFKYNLLYNNYKTYSRNIDQWKQIDEDGWNARHDFITQATTFTFNMYLKKSTNSRAFIGCSSDIYSIIIAYTIIPNYTQMLIRRTIENGCNCYTFLLGFQNVDYAAEFENLFESEVDNVRSSNTANLLADASQRGSKPNKSHVNTTVYHRDPVIAAAVKERAQGICDLCCQPAPFNRPNGLPYLEEHHLIRLADGGEDSINNAIALCPNCHRKMHIVNNPADTDALIRRLEYYASLLQP